ncbi:unnamed protein product [Pleuronectes platessa]|uniref:AlkB homolog 4, lysine demthylase n=1 Tax=Pleuronectes platessa TaxID=8262 RepID=A0A9N7Z381_PLEPL|nr:unnamed protein product [Pleuronectes platessa]
MAPSPDSSDSPCACKGVRRCLVCEQIKGTCQLEPSVPEVVHHFLYNPETRLAVCEDAEALSFPFPGVFLWENFISEAEEKALISSIDQDVWNQSQSGRRKQDFGPKVNFKKKKPVEQCNLDYHPQRGSAIDPHLDDSWLWGERLVTINMLSNTTLTMSLEQGLPELGLGGDVQVAVHLPRRSLLVLYDEARHRWKHGIHREDVHERRVCSTYRELSAEFLPGGQQAELGAQLLKMALSFQGTPI